MKSAYIISNNEGIQIESDYAICLPNNYRLNYFKGVDVEIINSNLILIGIVVNKEHTIDVLERESQKEIQDLDKIYEAVEKWSGRWVLIVGKTIIGDPLNSLNLFYGTLSQGNYISNSLGLLKKVGFDENQEIYNPSEKDEINWTISPYTRVNNIKVLLPFESIEISEFSLKENLRFLKANKTSNFEELKNYIIDNNRNYYNLGFPINLALTAGYDSRFLLSGLIESKIVFSNLTFVDSTIKKADFKVAQLISKVNKITHKIIRPNVMNSLLGSKKRKSMIDTFDIGNCQEIDRKWFISGLYESKKRIEIIFRGNIGTEIFQGNKNYLYYPLGDGTFGGIIESLKFKYPGLKNFQIEDLKRWWEYRKPFIEKNNLDWRLMFWLDQRCCAWTGAINSVFDLSDFRAINPLNSDYALRWFNTYTNQGNIENGYQEKLVELLCPSLNQYEYNPKIPDNIFKRVIKRFF